MKQRQLEFYVPVIGFSGNILFPIFFLKSLIFYISIIPRQQFDVFYKSLDGMPIYNE